MSAASVQMPDEDLVDRVRVKSADYPREIDCRPKPATLVRVGGRYHACEPGPYPTTIASAVSGNSGTQRFRSEFGEPAKSRAPGMAEAATPLSRARGESNVATTRSSY